MSHRGETWAELTDDARVELIREWISRFALDHAFESVREDLARALAPKYGPGASESFVSRVEPQPKTAEDPGWSARTWKERSSSLTAEEVSGGKKTDNGLAQEPRVSAQVREAREGTVKNLRSDVRRESITRLPAN